MNFKKNSFMQFGFSLIELMVVVAIIGILAAIGIPQYSKFQAKTRQTEAKSSLVAVFSSEVSFFNEWDQYSVDLRNIGFGVSGSRLRYMTGFSYAAGCTGYTTAAGAPTEVFAMSNTISCGSNVNMSTVSQAVAWVLPTSITVVANQCTVIPVGAYAGVLPTVGASSCVSTPGSQVFTAISLGDPNSDLGARFRDGWTIDQAKQISNTDAGIQ